MTNPLKGARSKNSLRFLVLAGIFSLSMLILGELLGEFAWYMRNKSSTLLGYHFGSAIYFGTFGFLIVSVFMRRNLEITDRIRWFRLFGCFIGLRFLLILLLPSLIFGNSLPNLLLSAYGGNYVTMSDIETISEGYDPEVNQSLSYDIGSLAIVVRKDIGQDGINEINRSLREYESGIKIRKAGERFFAYFNQKHEGGEFGYSPRLLWQSAVCDGYLPEPAKDFPDYKSWYFFTVCPFALIEFLALEIPLTIPIGILLWLLRAYIAPDMFSTSIVESEELE